MAMLYPDLQAFVALAAKPHTVEKQLNTPCTRFAGVPPKLDVHSLVDTNVTIIETIARDDGPPCPSKLA